MNDLTDLQNKVWAATDDIVNTMSLEYLRNHFRQNDKQLVIDAIKAEMTGEFIRDDVLEIAMIAAEGALSDE